MNNAIKFLYSILVYTNYKLFIFYDIDKIANLLNNYEIKYFEICYCLKMNIYYKYSLIKEHIYYEHAYKIEFEI